MKNSKVNLKEKSHPVFLEIDSGYSTIGSFEIIIKEGRNQPYVLYPDRVKKIHDNIPDVFLIPIEPDDLIKCKVLIHGKYRSAPYHEQIRVIYTFAQKGKLLEIAKMDSNIIEEVLENDVKSFYNIFSFKYA